VSAVDVPVLTTDVIPTWGATSITFDSVAGYTFANGNTDMTLTSTETGFEIDGGLNKGVWDKVNYNVNIDFPDDVGSQATILSQQLSVAVLQTETAAPGAGLTYENPIIVTDSNEFNLIRYARYSHFKLGADIVLSADWTTFAFSGTINGNGNDITVVSTLFSGVFGKRDSNTADLAAWKSSASNLRYGYIKNLKVILNSHITSAVFGKALNATFSSVDIHSTSNGLIVTSSSDIGSFVNEFEGNCYANDCTTDVNIEIALKSCSNIGGFAGKAGGTVCVIEECGSLSDILTGESFNVLPGTPIGVGALSAPSAALQTFQTVLLPV
jgi:hypothetical protein